MWCLFSSDRWNLLLPSSLVLIRATSPEDHLFIFDHLVRWFLKRRFSLILGWVSFFSFSRCRAIAVDNWYKRPFSVVSALLSQDTRYAGFSCWGFCFRGCAPISSCEENQYVFHFLWKSSLLVTTSADVSAANDSLYPPSDRFRHNWWLFLVFCLGIRGAITIFLRISVDVRVVPLMNL